MIHFTPAQPFKISAALTAVLMVAVTLSVVPASEAEASGACSTTGATTSFGGGAGNSGSPFLISTAEQLALLSTTSSAWNKHFKQTANIVMASGCIWTPIASGSVFSGTYDGDGFTISGLKTTNHDGARVGLISELAGGGTVKNVGVVGVDFVGKYHVGGLVGESSGTIQNSFATGQVVGKVQTGGLVGSFRGASISNSYARTSVSYNSLNPNPNNSGESYIAGGLVGASYSNGNISYSWSSGLVATPAAGVTYAIGGVFGRAVLGTVTFTSVFWDTDTSTQATNSEGSGHVGATTAQMLARTTYTGASYNIAGSWEAFNFVSPSNFWGICSGVKDGYPFLLWEFASNPCTSAPGAPTISAITAGNGQLSVAFTAPGSNGGASITNYDYSIDDGATWVTPSTPSTTSPVVITGLTNATVYPVKIRARNSVGGGTASNSVSGTPVAPSSSSSSSPVATPVAQVTPRTVRQPTIQQATADRPVRLLGKPLVKDVLFIADSAALSSATKQSLKKAARLAKASDARLALTGFAAVSGKGSAHEKAVAQRRALAVAKYLRKQGVEGWIYYHGLPAAKGKDFPGQPRRVEIRILK